MLVIIRGLPGSGKSTFARKNYPNAFHIENDMFHYHDGKYEFDTKKQSIAMKWCFETAIHALELGMDVVVSNTFTKKKYIQPLVEFADSHNISYKVIHLFNDFGDIHNVPKFVKENMKRGFEEWDGEESVVVADNKPIDKIHIF